MCLDAYKKEITMDMIKLKYLIHTKTKNKNL